MSSCDAFVCVFSTYWKQRAGTHPCVWHAAPADAQSLNIESEGSYSATSACHGYKRPLNLQHRVHMSQSTSLSNTCTHNK